MLIYLDVCCFNRPYDDQGQTRVRLETEAKLVLQEHVRSRKLALAWSYILDFEISQNPFPERAEAIFLWRPLAATRLNQSAAIVARARTLNESGIRTYDALHAACAMEAGCDLFVTTDDQLLRKLRQRGEIQAVPPGEALAIVESWYEDRG